MAEPDLTRPIIGIEYRSAQEVFDIMCDRFKHATPIPDQTNAEVSDERLPVDEIKAAMIAGWNACRKSIYAVCEDAQSEGEKHRSDTENEPRHHFGRGYLTAAKSIARGFNALEAMDDDNLLAALTRRSSQASEGARPIGYVTAEDFKAMQSEDAPDVTVFQEGSTYGCVALYAAPNQSKRVERLEAEDGWKLVPSAERWPALNVTSEELIRIKNTCIGKEGNVKIWSKMLWMMIEYILDLRAFEKEFQSSPQGETPSLTTSAVPAVPNGTITKGGEAPASPPDPASEAAYLASIWGLSNAQLQKLEAAFRRQALGDRS